MKLDFINGSGIYCFENVVNGKKYIGQADNLQYRTSHHRSSLRGGYDGCIALQNSWNKHGEENFKTYIIEECPVESLDDKEMYWIKELHTHVSENGLNISWGGNAFMRGRKHTDESRKKISENNAAPSGELNKQYGVQRTEEEKGKISAGLLKYYETHESVHLGTRQSSETIAKRSSSMMGRIVSQETRDKISKSNSGKVRTEEYCKRISEERKGRKASNETKIRMSLAKKGKSPNNKGVSPSKETVEKRAKALSGTKNRKNTSSKYVGVSLNKGNGKWVSYLNHGGKRYLLGNFEFEVDAALAYNKMALEFYGENAKINMIE